MTYELTDEVEALGDISFEGNIIPIEWFSHVKLANNKPDTISILILADIVYWYRPTTLRDETSGRIVGYKKKFKSDLLQRSYKELETLFGFSRDQLKDSLQRLEQAGLIKRVFRTLESQGTTLYNVMFIQIYPTKVLEITSKRNHMRKYPHTPEEISSEIRVNVHTPKATNPHTYTETRTKISTNTISLSNKQLIKSTRATVTTTEKEREMIRIWNEIVEEGKKEIQLTASRTKLLAKSFRESFTNNLENWKKFCLKIASSKFLMGEVTAFKASLEWSIAPDNIIKIEEEGYGIGDRLTKKQNKETSNEDILYNIFNAPTPGGWKKTQETLLREDGKDVYISWYSKLDYVSYEEGVLTLKASSKFIASHIDQTYSRKITAVAIRHMSSLKKVTFIT